MSWALIVLAAIVGLLGLAQALRLLAYSIRGVGMSYGVFFQLLIFGAGGLALAAWLLSWNLPAVLS